MSLLKPTLIFPKDVFESPHSPYFSYGIRISKEEVLDLENHLSRNGASSSPKAIVMFIGGFCDTIMRVVYREFLNFEEPLCYKIYSSFKCKELLSSWLTCLAQKKLPLFIIAHSWGASNLYAALFAKANQNLCIEYLLTLDPVGYKTPKVFPPCVKEWENIYVKNKLWYWHRSNLVALIGHAWNFVPYATHNAFVQKPSHHASIRSMLQASHFNAKLHQIIKT